MTKKLNLFTEVRRQILPPTTGVYLGIFNIKNGYCHRNDYVGASSVLHHRPKRSWGLNHNPIGQNFAVRGGPQHKFVEIYKRRVKHHFEGFCEDESFEAGVRRVNSQFTVCVQCQLRHEYQPAFKEVHLHAPNQ